VLAEWGVGAMAANPDEDIPRSEVSSSSSRSSSSSSCSLWQQ
jgi:hypothetical protein